MTTPHITTDELRDAYTRAGIFHKVGIGFEQARAIRTVRWALEKAALRHRERKAKAHSDQFSLI